MLRSVLGGLEFSGMWMDGEELSDWSYCHRVRLGIMDVETR